MKCPNCGGEVGNAKYCEFCGSQITAAMQKEREALNKPGCPKCGSTNIQFKRENLGEVRGKNAKKIVHATVGVCLDCGETWFPQAASGNAKKRKTFLWVLGWIFIFPLPLTIILVKKKNIKPILKFALIAIAWLLFLAIGFFGRTTDANTDKAAHTTSSVTGVSDAVKTTTPGGDVSTFEVALSVKPNVNSDDGSVLFGVSTNLPEDTTLLVTVKGDNYVGQDKVTILGNGTGYTSEFSSQGQALKGKYTVTVSMSLPAFQKEAVRQVVGEKGEHMEGQYVKVDDVTSAKYVSGDFEFTF